MNYGFFINRPVFASVISIIIVLAGLVCVRILPVAQYPDLLPPEVSVSAQYPGASAQTVAQTVAAQLEQQINGVDDMIYMKSTSNAAGTMGLTVTFAQGSDPDKATINVNNRVQRALPNLPETVQRLGVWVDKRNSAVLGVVTMQSVNGSYSRAQIGNYALVNVIDDLKRIPGVGDASIFGNVNYAMRIWLRPDKLAQYELTPTDVITAVREQNNDYAIGRFGDQPEKVSGAYTYSATTQGRLKTTEEFGNIILKSDTNGASLKLKDVARLELGTQQYFTDSRLSGRPAVPIMVNLQPGANAMATMKAIKARMAELARSFPPGVEWAVPYDTTTFITVSIEEVVHTFIEALILVIIVVYIFLQNWRATLIPVIAVPISIIGTFAGMYALGFSINMLTLFGLVLAIGIVVDDAIVVLENVERLVEEGMSPHDAAVESMREVSGPVIAIVLVLCSVFIPVSFMGGMAGVMYKQFAITIAISVVISGLVALTLAPALCSLLLRHRDDKRAPWKVFVLFNRFFDWLAGWYLRGVGFFLRHVAVGLAVFLAVCLAAFVLFKKVPGALVPAEDQGNMIAFTMLPPASSLARTDNVMRQAEKIFLNMPIIDNIVSIVGYDMLAGGLKPSAGVMFVMFKDWSKRKEPGQDTRNLVGPLIGMTSGLKDGFILPVNPPPIIGLSTTGGFQFYLQDRAGNGYSRLYSEAQKLIAAANKRPELAQVRTTFDANVPQYDLQVDRAEARAMNVPINTIYDALSATFGNVYINDFTLYGRNYQVKLQSEAEFRQTPEDLKQVFVRSGGGEMVPLDALVHAKRIVGSDQLERFNIFPAMMVMGAPAPGYTTGEAIKIIEQLAQELLPRDYQVAWVGSSYQEVSNSGQGNTAMLFGIIMVFLILAAQYERWSLPLAVITAVPFAVTGALLFTWLRGLSNDIYFQIGLVALVGLASKNAILIVEFASQERESGKNAMEAAYSAAKMRFRPIVMTSLAFILGVWPLARATGAGSASRHAIGTGVLGGMLFATCIAIFFVPMFYYAITRGSDKKTGLNLPPNGGGSPAPQGAGGGAVTAGVSKAGAGRAAAAADGLRPASGAAGIAAGFAALARRFWAPAAKMVKTLFARRRPAAKAPEAASVRRPRRAAPVPAAHSEAAEAAAPPAADETAPPARPAMRKRAKPAAARPVKKQPEA